MDVEYKMSSVFPLRLVIEGADAISSAEALLIDTEIIGAQEPMEAGQQKDLTTVATVVSIGGGAIGGVAGLVSLAEKLFQWRQGAKQSAQKIDKVLLITADGKRLLLEGSTAEDIKHLLQE